MSLAADLQAIRVLSDLDEGKLKKIEKITSVVTFKAGDYIFRENDYADHLYSVISGKVVLELGIDATRRCRVKDVFPGETCGISSVVDTGMRIYIAQAIAVADSRMFRWRGSDLEKLFYEDHETGFIFMRNIGKILKQRLQYTRAQLVSGLYAEHPKCA